MALLTPSEDSSTLLSFSPPTDVTIKSENHVTAGPGLVVSCTICIALMVVCVVVRFYTKLHIQKAWGWDDCLY